MKYPGDNLWTQVNQGDLLGSIYESFNIDLGTPGVVRTARKPFTISTSNTDSGLAHILCITYFGNNYVVITSSGIFEFDINGQSINDLPDDGNRPNTTTDSDGQVWDGDLYVTIDDNLSKHNGSTWTNTIEALNTGVPHPMTVFDSLATYKLAIGNGSNVLVSDGAGALGQTLTLPSQYEVTTLAYRNDYLYVGTRHLNGGEAKIFVWNGQAGNNDYEIPIGATWVQSLTPYKNTVAGVSTKGELFVVNGTAATQIGTFPVYNENNLRWPRQPNDPFDGKITHRGMVTVGEDIYLNVDGTTQIGNEPRMKSGIWVWNRQAGLHHRTSYSSDLFVTDSGITASNSIVTTSVAHNLKDGDAIEFSVVSGLSGIKTSRPYFVSVQSTTTFKIAISRKALAKGNFVTITGTATSDAIRYVPNTDWGTQALSSSGAIALTTPYETAQDSWHGQVIWGARIQDKDGTNIYGLFSSVDAWNISRFTTTKIYSGSVVETWKNLFSFIKGVFNSNEEVILKYKKEDDVSYPTETYQGVWGSATEIHSVASSYNEDEWDDIENGDELTITDGYGRGYTCHVTNTDNSSSTFVITVDESIGTAEQSVYFYADNFRKVQSIGNTREYKGLLQWAWDVVKSPWIMLKVEMRGFATEFTMFDIDNGRNK